MTNAAHRACFTPGTLGLCAGRAAHTCAAYAPGSDGHAFTGFLPNAVINPRTDCDRAAHTCARRFSDAHCPPNPGEQRGCNRLDMPR